MTIRAHVKRLKLIIYPQFQLTLLLGNLIVTSGIFFFIYYSVKEAFLRLEEDVVIQGLGPGHPYFEFAHVQSEIILNGIFASFLVGVFTSTIWMLLISNKLSGPILRLRGYFTSIANGEKDFPEVSFRKGDFFSDLPPVINKALQEIKSTKN